MPDEQKPLTRLEDLDANEVSLVDRGAIQRPFLIVKSESGQPAIDLSLTADQAKRFKEATKGLKSMVRKDDASGLDEDGNPIDPLQMRAEQAGRAIYRIMCANKDVLTEDFMDSILDAVDLDDDLGDETDDTDEANAAEDALEDATQDTEGLPMADTTDNSGAADWSPSKPADMSDEDFAKALAAAKAAFASAISKADDDDKDKVAMKKADDDKKDDEDEKDKDKVEKADGESFDSLVQKARAQAEREYLKKNAALEARVAHLEGERILKSYEGQVKNDCLTLGKDPGQVAKIVKAAFDVSKEAGDAYLSLLQESASIAKDAVFKNVGTSHTQSFGESVPTEGQGGPHQRYQAMVKHQITKGLAKNEAEAHVQVQNTKQGAEAYNQMHRRAN